jgi:hypothetical protein
MFAFGIHHALHLETVIPAVKSLLDDVELYGTPEDTLEQRNENFFA